MTTADFSKLLALGIFSSYFLLIIGLFSIILTSLPRLTTPKRRWSVYAFQGLTLASFVHTWFYMFKFLAWSFMDYDNALDSSNDHMLDRMSNWLSNTALFEQAWAAVCSRPGNWWWSEQLCLFTVGAWTVLLATEGRRHRVRHLWAYMLLGQVVAISVASNLFYLALVLSQAQLQPKSTAPPRMAPPSLWISVLLSLVTVGISPFTSQSTFLPNLLVMHVLLLVPLVPLPSQKAPYGRSTLSMQLSTLYALTTLLAIAFRMRTTAEAMLSLPAHTQSLTGLASAVWEVLHSHPAQSSIGWDVIWTTISFVAWILARPAKTVYVSAFVSAPTLLVASSLGSVGVTAPYILRQDVDGITEAKATD